MNNGSQSKDAGLALVLILLITIYFTKEYTLILLTIGILVLVMTIPGIFKPFAIVWFGFSKYLGTFSSKIILSLLFLIVITPVSLARRLFKADSLQLRSFYGDAESAFQESHHEYKKADLQNPY